MGSDRAKWLTRCCYLAVTLVALSVMFWVAWCLLSLTAVTSGQRRAIVHYSPTPSTPVTEETSVSNAISKLPTTSSAKGDFAPRDKQPLANDTHRTGTSKPFRNPTPVSESKGSAPEDVHARRVASSAFENRAEGDVAPTRAYAEARTESRIYASRVETVPSKRDDKDELVDSVPEFVKGETRRQVAGDSSSVDRGRQDEDEERGSKGRYRGRESDERYSKGDTRVYPDDADLPKDDTGLRETPEDDKARKGDEDDEDDRYRYRYQDDRRRLRGEERYRPREDERYKDRDGGRYRDRDVDSYRDRNDDKSKDRDDRYRDRDDGRYRDRDDERYRDRDDRYRDRDDDRYRNRDDDRYRDRDDRYRDRDDRYRDRDDDRYRDRGDDRYRDRDDDRYRDRDDRYRDRDDDRYRDREDRYKDRDDERYRVRDDRYESRDDEGKPRYRDDDKYRSRDGDDKYGYRGSERHGSRDDDEEYREKKYSVSEDDRYKSRDSKGVGDDPRDLPKRASREKGAYRPRDDEDDRYVSVPAPDDRDKPSRSATVGDRKPTTSSRYEYSLRSDETVTDYDIPVRPRPTYADEDRDRERSRDDEDRRPYRYEKDRVEISPTRARDESSRSDDGDWRYVDRGRPRDKDRTRDTVIQGSRRSSVDETSRRYADDRETYRPVESTLRDEVVRRSYASDEEYERGSRRDDDRRRTGDTRRKYQDDESYSRRDRVGDDDDEYWSRSTSERGRRRDRYDDDDSIYDDRSPPRPVRKYHDEDELPRRDPNRTTRIEGSRVVESSRGRDDARPSRRDDYRPSRNYDEDSSEDGRRYSERPRRPANTREPSMGPGDPVTREKRYQDKPRESEELPRAVRPLSAKDVIEAANRQSDTSESNVRKVFYPVFDPRLSNLTSPEVIQPSERRGTTITLRKRRSV